MKKFFFAVVVLILSCGIFTTFAENTINTAKLTISKSEGVFIFSGSIDTTKHTNFKQFDIHGFIYDDSSKTTTPESIGAYPATIANDGAYTFRTITESSLTPGKRYFFKQTVKDPASGVEKAEVYPFTADGVIIPEGSVAEQKYLNSKSYNLLAPWPGLSVLMDPDLCAQKKIETGNQNLICDINGFLNFAFKTLIGLTAVVLVLRLMYEGYQYMVTDVPFLKASAKSGFFTALAGLLLALSAYLILNTINPKLVTNTISIDQVTVGIEKTQITPETFKTITGRAVKAKPELLAIVKSVAQTKGIDACIPQAIIQQENAGWDETLVGCDENVAREGIPSRQAFIQSGITLMEKPVSENGLLDKTVRNDNFTGTNCKFDTSKPGYNLDWRFSKGFGLSQQTIFPEGYNKATWFADVKRGGALWNKRSSVPSQEIANLLRDPKTQVESLISIYRTNAANCLTDLQKSFSAYNGGNCNTTNPSAVAYGRQVKANYDLCKQNGG